MRTRRNSVAVTVSGVAAALGLSVAGVVLGAMAARALDASEAVPDRVAHPTWLVLAMLGTIGSGAMVADVAPGRARRSAIIAGAIVFLVIFEIMRSVESTGVEGTEWPVVLGVSTAYVGLLLAGIWIGDRRRPT